MVRRRGESDENEVIWVNSAGNSKQHEPSKKSELMDHIAVKRDKRAQRGNFFFFRAYRRNTARRGESQIPPLVRAPFFYFLRILWLRSPKRTPRASFSSPVALSMGPFLLRLFSSFETREGLVPWENVMMLIISLTRRTFSPEEVDVPRGFICGPRPFYSHSMENIIPKKHIKRTGRVQKREALRITRPACE